MKADFAACRFRLLLHTVDHRVIAVGQVETIATRLTWEIRRRPEQDSNLRPTA